jgi:hypothetical protein
LRALEGEDRAALQLDAVDVRRQLKMGMEGRGGAIAVVGGARGEQLAVELLVPVLELVGTR